MEKLLDIVNSVDVAIPNRGYWYLRTEAGALYEEFRDNSYVAINYNYIHPSSIQVNNEEHLRNLITKNEPKFEGVNYKDLDPGKKSSVTKYVGILKNFNDMNKGDIIVIPSADSHNFSIGKIADNNIYLPEAEDLENCDYLLRRKVIWEKKDAYISEYSPIIYSLKHSHLALTKIEKHSEYLNGILQPLFFQNNKFYFTLNIKKEEDIPLVGLKKLLDSYYGILHILNDGYSFGEEIDEAVIKLNLNSKGKLNLIQEKKSSSTRSLTAAAILLGLFATSCSTSDLSRKTDLPTEKVEKLKKEIDNFNEARDILHIPDDEMFGKN